jgi:hypothetical protein
MTGCWFGRKEAFSGGGTLVELQGYREWKGARGSAHLVQQNGQVGCDVHVSALKCILKRGFRYAFQRVGGQSVDTEQW